MLTEKMRVPTGALAVAAARRRDRSAAAPGRMRAGVLVDSGRVHASGAGRGVTAGATASCRGCACCCASTP
uniref:Uncharacterized protein n=1 Tax=Arundo donax TaxID=35708 RepID=A0A0A9GP70_ARUDO